MLSAIIQSGSNAERLARTIGSLVPAVAEGVLGDGHVIASDPGGDIERVADAAGCNIVTGETGAALASAVRLSRSSHILFLPAGSVLETGWWVEAARFIKQSGDGRMEAVFSHAAQEYGLAASSAAAMRGTLARLIRRPLPGQGLIAHRSAVEGRLKPGRSVFPPRPAGRVVFLKARAFVLSD